MHMDIATAICYFVCILGSSSGQACEIFTDEETEVSSRA